MPKTSPSTQTPKSNVPSSGRVVMGAGVAPHPSSHFSSPPSRSVLLFHAARPIRRIPRNHGAGFLNPQKAQRSRARKSSIAYLSPPGNLPRAPFFPVTQPRSRTPQSRNYGAGCRNRHAGPVFMDAGVFLRPSSIFRNRPRAHFSDARPHSPTRQSTCH